MTCARIVAGASGLIGAAITRRLARLPGPLLALDARPAPPEAGHPVTRTDLAGDELPGLLTAHLNGATRAELYHTAGHVPDLARITDTPPDLFARALDDLTTAYTVLRTFALAVDDQHVPAASAVLLSSVGARRAHRYLAGYDAARAATESLARSFTLEFGDRLAVRAAAIGPIAQSASTAADGDLLPALLALVPRGAYADLDDIADAVAAFGGPSFDAAAGHTLTLDQGLTVQLRPAQTERPPGPPGGARSAGGQVDTGNHASPHTN